MTKPKHPGGRPPKIASERASADINIRTTKATKTKLKAAANARGLSLSAHLIDSALAADALRAQLQQANNRLLAKDQRLLKHAYDMRDAGERITRLESVGTAMAKRLGLGHYLVKEWEKLTGEPKPGTPSDAPTA